MTTENAKKVNQNEMAELKDLIEQLKETMDVDTDLDTCFSVNCSNM